MMQGGTACGHLLANRPESAMTWAERAVASQPHYWIAWCVLAAARVNLGDLKGAQETFAHVKAIDPDLSAANLLDVFPLRRPEDIRNWTDALRRAGLPG